MQGLSKSTGLPPDQIKYVSALLAGIPMGYIFRAITSDPFSLQASMPAVRSCVCSAHAHVFVSNGCSGDPCGACGWA